MMHNRDANGWRMQYHSCLAAFMFYTRLPIPKNTPHNQEILNRSRIYFPLVGLTVGALTAATLVVSQAVFPYLIATLIALVVSVLLTGAFHEDGFADCCDGFGGGWEKEQVLTIMKDSRVGTYAVVGLILLFGLKLAALEALVRIDLKVACVTLVFAAVSSRFCSSVIVDTFDYVQDIDASKAKPMTLKTLSVLEHGLGLLLIGAMFLACVLAVGFVAPALGVIAATTTTLVFARYSFRRIGGYTGDVLGAIQQLSELTLILGVLAGISLTK